MSDTLTMPATLPETCRTRAELVRAHWAELTARYPRWASTYAPSPAGTLWRLGWDPHAAAEYPRMMLATAEAVETLWPAYAERVWHHAAGATILHLPDGPFCCSTPGAHRDALVAMARELRAFSTTTDPGATRA